MESIRTTETLLVVRYNGRHMRWPWKKAPATEVSAPQMESMYQNEETLTSFQDESKRDFSFYWFFLVFWLTVIATVLISWRMIE